MELNNASRTLIVVLTPVASLHAFYDTARTCRLLRHFPFPEVYNTKHIYMQYERDERTTLTEYIDSRFSSRN